jgi:hypothetical protein
VKSYESGEGGRLRSKLYSFRFRSHKVSSMTFVGTDWTDRTSPSQAPVIKSFAALRQLAVLPPCTNESLILLRFQYNLRLLILCHTCRPSAPNPRPKQAEIPRDSRLRHYVRSYVAALKVRLPLRTGCDVEESSLPCTVHASIRKYQLSILASPPLRATDTEKEKEKRSLPLA